MRSSATLVLWEKQISNMPWILTPSVPFRHVFESRPPSVSGCSSLSRLGPLPGYRIVEVNARLSRSSALASKAGELMTADSNGKERLQLLGLRLLDILWHMLQPRLR